MAIPYAAVWAIGQDPPTGVRRILRDMLNEHEAHYFNGHQHDFEHIVVNSHPVRICICTCFSNQNIFLNISVSILMLLADETSTYHLGQTAQHCPLGYTIIAIPMTDR